MASFGIVCWHDQSGMDVSWTLASLPHCSPSLSPHFFKLTFPHLSGVQCVSPRPLHGGFLAMSCGRREWETPRSKLSSHAITSSLCAMIVPPLASARVSKDACNAFQCVMHVQDGRCLVVGVMWHGEALNGSHLPCKANLTPQCTCVCQCTDGCRVGSTLVISFVCIFYKPLSPMIGTEVSGGAQI